MPVFLFEIEMEDEIYTFGLHTETYKQANKLVDLMETAEYIGELESPDMHKHEVDKNRLN